jgi:phage gpG-like protein
MIDIHLQLDLRGYSGFGDVSSLVDIERILDDSTAVILNRIRTCFLAERDPVDNSPWVPSKAGLARRAKGSTGTLFDTGNLFHSIQLATEKGRRFIGTDVDYGEKFQYGIGVIQRRFLGFSPEDEGTVRDIALDILRRGISGV